MRFFVLAPALSLALAACSSSAPGTHPTADGGTFVQHAPSEHLASAPTCAPSTDGGGNDQCTKASDCPSGQSCMCGTQFNGNAAFKPNQCVPAACITDADCGPGGYCSPSSAPMCGNGTYGYFCHTNADECDDSSDCAGYASCTWTGSSWTCQQAHCAG